MLDYYERRAPEYEAVYSRPERRHDLAELESEILQLVAGERVLELACGTGYWTRRMAGVAESVLATDGSARLAQGAAESCGGAGTVHWTSMDAYAAQVDGTITCIVAGFFWSHVPLSRLDEFLVNLAARARRGTRLVLFDNRYVAGSSTPITGTDADGNTFQRRVLADGSEHVVLKNFATAAQLRQTLSPVADRIRINELGYFWLASCRLGGG